MKGWLVILALALATLYCPEDDSILTWTGRMEYRGPVLWKLYQCAYRHRYWIRD